MSAPPPGADMSMPDLGAPAACTIDGQTLPYSASRPLGYYEGDPLPKHVAYLTFDDGPSDWTIDFLDILKAKGVPATFFINAMNTKGKLGLDGNAIGPDDQPVPYDTVLAREVREGHALGNHTVDHVDLTPLAESDVALQLDQNELLINAALIRAGIAPMLVTLLRPPFSRPWELPGPPPANYQTSLNTVGRVFMTRGLNVFYNLNSTDAADGAIGETYMRHPPQPPTVPPTAPTWAAKVARIHDAVLGSAAVRAGDGVVIIMHDIHPTTRDALPDIIDGLRAAGYSFGTMEDYARWRWGRGSAEMTAGPSRAYDACAVESNWGCRSFGVPGDRAHEVCGRMWMGFEQLGGVSVLGAPTAAPSRSSVTGVITQELEHARLELYPQDPNPHQVVVEQRDP